MPEIPIFFSQWLIHYGEVALFVLLALGIIGLPIPDETLLAFAGFLAAQHKLSLPLTLIVGFLGAVAGITFSYFMGFTLGHFLLERYGPKFGITEAKVQYVQNWFDRIGKWAIFFGYFVPGVRHITGYLAGATRLHFLHFALFAYAGALVWSQGFILLGYYFGNKWSVMVDLVLNYIWYGVATVIVILLFYLLRIMYRRSR